MLDWIRRQIVRHRAFAGALPLGLIAGLVIAVFPASQTAADPLERISVSAFGEEADGPSAHAVVSDNGRYVVFASAATNLVEGDVNGFPDVFLKDRLTGEVELISVADDGTQGNDWSGASFSFETEFKRMDVSPDGRFVVFTAAADNLVVGEVLVGLDHVYLRDRQAGTTEVVNFDANGVPSGSFVGDYMAVSDDGNRVVYMSPDETHDTGDDVIFVDVFVYDRTTQTTELVTVNSDGEQAAPGGENNDNNASHADISGDGRFVVFQTRAPNLVPDDTNDLRDVFIRDLDAGTTERVSVALGGGDANGISELGALEPDGRFVAFTSTADNIVAGTPMETIGIYLRDLQAGTTERVNDMLNFWEEGQPGRQILFHGKGLSDDARFLVFRSGLEGLTGNDTNGLTDVFRLERNTGEITLLSENTAGVAPDTETRRVSISEDSRVSVFSSEAADLVEGDTNRVSDVFATGDILPPAHPYEYATKVVCGVQDDPADLRLAPGTYATAINVHSPKDPVATFSKKLALSVPPGGQSPGEILPIAVHEIGYDEVIVIDCMDLRNRLFPDGFPSPDDSTGAYIEGYLVIESSAPLDVTAVYTTATVAGDSGELHSSIDVEQVPERKRESDLSVTKSALVIPFGRFSDTTQLWGAIYNISVNNAGPDTAPGVLLRDDLTADVTGGIAAILIDFPGIVVPPGAVVTDAQFINILHSTFSVDLGDLGPGETANVIFGAFVISVSFPGVDPTLTITDRAAVSSLGIDPSPADNVDIVETVLLP
ncbi:hypothetical protein KUH32_01410 [Thalassococcus sp. CAU 1522]|uniref:DUF11 domain-containing protein n=1 Tax=Thalassococcus arenae TaxID=2851652 RepID=A0ABS6N4A6_9RHOB|nr:DUF11 domain-containing protein [Thalassococcus arenae]MBV2358419.1 hypothetical protein [Thalassococcus arenae]